MGIDLILAVDSIVPPLTGIGRYTFELAGGMRRHAQIDTLRCFDTGRWAPDPDPAQRWSAAPVSSGKTLRSVLAGNELAVRAYHALVPRLAKFQLRREADALFHSPSYFLPPFPGLSVATVHDLSHEIYPHFHPPARVLYAKRAFPDALKRADHLITDAESVRREVIEQFSWPADRVTAVPLGVGAEFRVRATQEILPVMQKYGLTSSAYSLYVGTIEPRKNLDRLLSAYELLPIGLRRNFPLVMVGAPGWLSGPTHVRMETAAAAGWLRYLSFVSQADLPLLYAGARLFVYPSLYEGFGLPVLEAMACGVPVITSNVSSLPEVVGDAGWLVNPLDIAEISAALQSVLQDDPWRMSAATSGLARACRFSWTRCVDETVAVYRSIQLEV